jgi:hypothetical protein
VEWFVESQEEKAEAEGKWMMGRSPVAAIGAGEALDSGVTSFVAGRGLEEARRADDLRVDIASVLWLSANVGGCRVMLRTREDDGDSKALCARHIKTRSPLS